MEYGARRSPLQHTGRGDGVTLLGLEPITGRIHARAARTFPQVRVQAAALLAAQPGERERTHHYHLFVLRVEPDPQAFALRHLLLPSVTLGVYVSAVLARFLRASLVSELNADYVRTAVAKGLPQRRVIGVHTMRNSLIPVITFIGADFGALLGGAIVTESVFNIPGLGRAVYDAVLRQEGAVVVGIVTLFVFFYIFFNLVVDVLYAALDPRIRYE